MHFSYNSYKEVIGVRVAIWPFLDLEEKFYLTPYGVIWHTHTFSKCTTIYDKNIRLSFRIEGYDTTYDTTRLYASVVLQVSTMKVTIPGTLCR
jgi:hypothetical protein